MNTENFGKMIYKLRKKAGMTQSELATRLNISDKAVSKWEVGAGYPEITLLPALSEIFSVSVDYLLKGNPHGIAIAGNIIVDTVNVIDKYPEKTMLANVLKVDKSVGGCVPNTLIDLAKIDPDLSLSALGKVGNDEDGRFMVSTMKQYGIDTDGVIVSETLPTSCTNVMSELKTGERTFFYTKGANSDLDIDDIPVDSLECDIFHIGYLCLLDALDAPDEQYGTRMGRLLHAVNKRGIKTSIDAISAESEEYAQKIIPVLKYCNYVIVNEIESSMVSGISPRNDDGSLNVENIKATMKVFLDYGVQDKIIIHCCEAGFMMNKNGSFIAVPSLKLPAGYIKGSVGAGDAFAAGTLYGLYKGYDDQQILEFASCTAAMSLSEADSISGMKPKREVEKLNELFERSELQ